MITLLNFLAFLMLLAFAAIFIVRSIHRKPWRSLARGYWLLALAAVLLLITSGCVSNQSATGTASGLLSSSGGAIGVAEGFATPEQKAALVKLRDVLVGRQVNPIEGFDRVIEYTYKGDPIDPAFLARTIIYKKREAIQDAQYVAAGTNTTAQSLSADAALIAEIDAILKAAGVEE